MGRTARFQWGELMQSCPDIFDVDSVVREVPGCLISDSRNVYDKLQTSELSAKGAERRTDIELMCLKASQRNTGLILRWVHSEAQLGNALTKPGGKELDNFYHMGFQWRIVQDGLMRSARKRRTEGLRPLEHTARHTVGDG